jgi:hypothetical protein
MTTCSTRRHSRYDVPYVPIVPISLTENMKSYNMRYPQLGIVSVVATRGQ